MTEVFFTFHWWIALESMGSADDANSYFLRFAKGGRVHEVQTPPSSERGYILPKVTWPSDIAKILSFRIKMGKNYPLSLIEMIQSIFHSRKKYHPRLD